MALEQRLIDVSRSRSSDLRSISCARGGLDRLWPFGTFADAAIQSVAGGPMVSPGSEHSANDGFEFLALATCIDIGDQPLLLIVRLRR